MYRFQERGLEVLLVHPGGPFWLKKDHAAWSIPKGLANPGEDKFQAAKREFLEETSVAPSPPFLELGQIKQKSGKMVHAWAFEGNCEVSSIKSSSFTLEWPPKSGVFKEFPEVDRPIFHDR